MGLLQGPRHQEEHYRQAETCSLYYLLIHGLLTGHIVIAAREGLGGGVRLRHGRKLRLYLRQIW